MKPTPTYVVNLGIGNDDQACFEDHRFDTIQNALRCVKDWAHDDLFAASDNAPPPFDDVSSHEYTIHIDDPLCDIDGEVIFQATHDEAMTINVDNNSEKLFFEVWKMYKNLKD